MESMRVSCGDGKYEWILDGNKLICRRHGEDWRDETGDNAILALLQEVDAIRTRISALEDENAKLRAVIGEVPEQWEINERPFIVGGIHCGSRCILVTKEEILKKHGVTL